jgi:hypothetical protein
MICANFLADPNWNPTPEQLPAFDGVGTAEQDSTIEDQIADLEQKLQDQ